MDKKRVLDMMSNISKFTDDEFDARIKHPFSIIGPSGRQKSLRVYAYGGSVGKIGLDGAGCSLCDRDYFRKHRSSFTDKEQELTEKWIEDSRSKTKEITGEWVCDVLDSEAYLRIVLKALKLKFVKNDGTDKERNIQMEILSNRNGNRHGWNIIDVETGVTKKWVKNSSMIKTVKKTDFVVYDSTRREFGIIELKVDNVNTENLGEHYSVFHAIYEDPAYFINEISRRAKAMAEYGLAENENYDECEKVWFGFLFVGNGVMGARKCVEKYLLKDIPIEKIEQDCRFLYADTVEMVEKCGICYNRMLDVNGFMGNPKRE